MTVLPKWQCCYSVAMETSGDVANVTLGLRERRRRQTMADIHDAAMTLFETQGITATTVDEIAAAAGVSPRTFFRYFPTKESAAYLAESGLDDVIDEAVERLAAGAELVPTLDHIWQCRFGKIDEIEQQPDQLRRGRQLLETEPILYALGVQNDERLSERLADAVRRAPDGDSEDLAPLAVIAAFTAIARVAFLEWARRSEAGEACSARDLYHQVRTGVAGFAGDLAKMPLGSSPQL